MPPNDGPAINIKGLSLELDGARILEAVNFRVEKGEFVALVGPNGAGKSSLMRCIARIHSSYSGDIVLNGTLTSKMPPKKLARLAAYVPQGGGETGAFTARDFVSLARYPWKKPFEPETADDVRIVNESMKLCGVATFAERPMDSLSGGERQKVLISAALAQQSEILLLDEPTAYLDYRHQVDLLRLIRLIHTEGRKTVLVVTHDLNFALQSADRLIVLSGGTVVWEGTPRAMLEANLLESLFSTDFLYLGQGLDGFPFVIPSAFSSLAAYRESGRL